MSMAELALTGDFAVVHEVVCRHVPAFVAHGFEFKGVTLDGSPESDRYPAFHFSSERSAMEIDISFFSAAGGLNGGFMVFIIKPVDHMLNVKDYLKLHGREALARFFSYRDPATDIRSFAETFLQMLGGLLDRDLKPIIEGRTFEETPIDWMGYK